MEIRLAALFCPLSPISIFWYSMNLGIVSSLFDPGSRKRADAIRCRAPLCDQEESGIHAGVRSGIIFVFRGQVNA
jgi:hypothetical protein